MKILNIKTLIATALILTMTLSTLMAGIPAANAAVSEWDTFAYLIISPEVAGVGQGLVVQYRIDKTVPVGSVLGPYWTGFTVKITKPDGTTETKGPLTADSTGGSWLAYTPTTVGTYSFQMSFPGQWINWTGGVPPGGFVPLDAFQRWYKPSTSKIVQVTVQQDPIPTYPTTSLPADYWTRPIDAEIKGAWQSADNWLMQGYDYAVRSFSGTTTFAPYTSAPETSHVMWTKPIMFGGVVGGPTGDKSYYTGLSYEQPYTPLIIQGRIIYTETRQVMPLGGGTYCVDLQTGEQIWYLNNTVFTYAQLFDYNSPNEHGIIPHLIAVVGGFPSPLPLTWNFYNPFDGKFLFAIANASSGTTVFGPSGELLVYSFTGFTGATRRYLMWNSTQALELNGAISNPAITPGVIHAYNPTIGATFDGNRGYQWNVSVPNMGWNVYIQRIGDGVVLTSTGMVGTPQNFGVYPIPYVHTAFPATIDKLSNGSYPTSINYLWQQNRTNIYGMFERLSQNIGEGVYVMYDEATLQFHGYDVKTGAEKWVTAPFNGSDFGQFSRDYHIAYGKLFSAGYDGHVRAYNIQTGKLIWDYYFGSAGFETPYGTWPVYNGFTIADGKIYVANDEHSPDAILWRGGSTVCLNATTGNLLWKMSGWLRIPAIVDGYLTAVNAYDNQIYTIGRGPSATTVAAPLTAVPLGTGLTITGKVTDQSTGAKGTPAISDADMTQWMEYMYQQKQMPTNAKGVDIILTAVDPNGNSQTIGTTTSDIGGSYGLSWTPPVEGTYQVMATFAGTNSYGSSYATTYLTVGPAAATPAPVATPTPTPTTAPTSTPAATASPSPAPQPEAGPSTDIYIIAAAAVVIIVVVAVAALVLRKRK